MHRVRPRQTPLAPRCRATPPHPPDAGIPGQGRASSCLWVVRSRARPVRLLLPVPFIEPMRGGESECAGRLQWSQQPRDLAPKVPASLAGDVGYERSYRKPSAFADVGRTVDQVHKRSSDAHQRMQTVFLPRLSAVRLLGAGAAQPGRQNHEIQCLVPLPAEKKKKKMPKKSCMGGSCKRSKGVRSGQAHALKSELAQAQQQRQSSCIGLCQMAF